MTDRNQVGCVQAREGARINVNAISNTASTAGHEASRGAVEHLRRHWTAYLHLAEIHPIGLARPVGAFSFGLNFPATVAIAGELDGQRCRLNDWAGRSRKTTQRLRTSVLRGRSASVDRATGAPARAGVASESKPRPSDEFIGQALTGRPQRASNGNLMRAQARCSETTRISSVYTALCQAEHRSLSDGGVVPVSSRCPRLPALCRISQ